MGKERAEEIKIFDGIHRVPIDKTARLVVQKGEHYAPDVKIQEGKEHWENQPHFYPIPKNSIVKKGQRQGRLVVLGKRYRSDSRNTPPRYIVRCDCGRFEVRTSRSIRNHKNINDRCDFCWNNARIKQSACFIQNGATGKKLRDY